MFTTPCLTSTKMCVPLPTSTDNYRMYQLSVKIRENDLPVGGDFQVITNSIDEDLGSGVYPNDHVFIPANLTA